MKDILRTAELSGAAGISISYASEILSGKRKPSRSLAIHIFRITGWRHGSIADLSDRQIETLESLEPWAPRSTAGDTSADVSAPEPDAVALCSRCGVRAEHALITSCTSVHCPMRALDTARLEVAA